MLSPQKETRAQLIYSMSAFLASRQRWKMPYFQAVLQKNAVFKAGVGRCHSALCLIRFGFTVIAQS